MGRNTSFLALLSCYKLMDSPQTVGVLIQMVCGESMKGVDHCRSPIKKSLVPKVGMTPSIQIMDWVIAPSVKHSSILPPKGNCGPTRRPSKSLIQGVGTSEWLPKTTNVIPAGRVTTRDISTPANVLALILLIRASSPSRGPRAN